MTIKRALRQLLIVIPFGLLINCSREKTTITENIEENVDTVFIEFIDNIRNQTLPLHISCGLTDNLVSSDEFEKFKNFIPKRMDRVFGKIKSQNDKYRLVVYGLTGDDIYPFLYSYDNSGQVRDSLDLMLTGCGGADGTQIPHSFATIDQNLTITLVDTTRFIHYPDSSKDVEDYIVDSLRTLRMVIKMDENGHFVKQ